MRNLYFKRIFLYCCTLLFAIFVFIHIPYVQKFCIEHIFNAKLRNQGIEIKLNKVYGFLPCFLQIQNASIKDKQGKFASVGHLSIYLDIPHLLKGDLALKKLNLSHVQVLRKPNIQTEDNQYFSFENSQKASLAVLLKQYNTLKKLKIHNVVLHETILGKTHFFEAYFGACKKIQNKKNIKVRFRTKDETFTKVSGFIHKKHEELKFYLKGYDQPQGVMNHLFKSYLPENSKKIKMKSKGYIPYKNLTKLLVKLEIIQDKNAFCLLTKFDSQAKKIRFNNDIIFRETNCRTSGFIEENTNLNRILLSQVSTKKNGDTHFFPLIDIRNNNGLKILLEMGNPLSKEYGKNDLKLFFKYKNKLLQGDLKIRQKNKILLDLVFGGNLNEVQGILNWNGPSQYSQEFRISYFDSIFKACLTKGLIQGRLAYCIKQNLLQGDLFLKKIHYQNNALENLKMKLDCNLKKYIGDIFLIIGKSSNFLNGATLKIKSEKQNNLKGWNLQGNLKTCDYNFSTHMTIDPNWENLLFNDLTASYKKINYNIFKKPILLNLKSLTKIELSGDFGDYKFFPNYSNSHKSLDALLNFNINSNNISKISHFTNLPVSAYLSKVQGKFHLKNITKNFQAKGNLNSEIIYYKSKINQKAEIDLGKNFIQWNLNLLSHKNLKIKSSGKLDLYSYKISNRSSITSSINGKLNLDWFFKNFALKTTIIKGFIKGNVNINGNLKNPLFSGSLSLLNGSYENTSLGTRIIDIFMLSTIKNNCLLIHSLQGHDGVEYKKKLRGRVEGKGNIDFKNISSPKIKLRLYLKNIDIANNDKFRGQASGNIDLKGNIPNIEIGGDVNIDYADLFLEELDDDDPLGVIFKNLKKKNKQHINLCCPMNLNLNIPRNFVINGLGFDSKWKGAMIVKGFINQPYLVGELNLIKGKLYVFGKRLTLQKGIITYYDDSKGIPFLSIRSGKKVKNVEVIIEIKGYANHPVITPLSFPAKPQEQVLSLLLFDTDTSRLSINQSIELASAISGLNKGKGNDFFDKIKSSFGLDTIEIKDIGSSDNNSSGEEKKHALSIGKDFGSFKISVDQGTSSNSNKVTLETNISSNLNLSADIGNGQQSSSVGLDWIYSY